MGSQRRPVSAGRGKPDGDFALMLDVRYAQPIPKRVIRKIPDDGPGTVDYLEQV